MKIGGVDGVGKSSLMAICAIGLDMLSVWMSGNEKTARADAQAV